MSTEDGPSSYLDSVLSSLWMSTQNISAQGTCLPLEELVWGYIIRKRETNLETWLPCLSQHSPRFSSAETIQYNDVRLGNMGSHPSQLAGLVFHISIMKNDHLCPAHLLEAIRGRNKVGKRILRCERHSEAEGFLLTCYVSPG